MANSIDETLIKTVRLVTYTVLMLLLRGEVRIEYVILF